MAAPTSVTLHMMVSKLNPNCWSFVRKTHLSSCVTLAKHISVAVSSSVKLGRCTTRYCDHYFSKYSDCYDHRFRCNYGCVYCRTLSQIQPKQGRSFHSSAATYVRGKTESHKIRRIREHSDTGNCGRREHVAGYMDSETSSVILTRNDFHKINQSETDEYDSELFEDGNEVPSKHDEDTEKLQNNHNDVCVEGDATSANKTYRKTAERKALGNNADPNSAATVAVHIRKQLKEESKAKQTGKGKEEQLSKPNRKDLRHQTQDLSRLQPSTVASILTKCVIYNEGDIVAIDKPYGLPSHGGPGVTHSIDGLLPKLARNLAKKGEENPKLHLVHRLDKETTGVMVLAKKEDVLRRLQAMFRQRKVVKKYWVITAGLPDPPSGIIDMPMVETEIGGRFRMVVKPDVSSAFPDMLHKRKQSSATEAVTKFKVLDSGKKWALVELEALTGVKHQIRVHLAQGMACPILGDHKYSHYSKQAPQRLHIRMLEHLGISQQKVRTVPMHLHAQMLFLPEFFEDGRNLRISTKLPKFFAANMKKLKLHVP